VTHIGLRLPGKVIAGRPHRSALPKKAIDLGLSSFLMFGEDGQTSTWDRNMELKKTKSLRTAVLEKERPFSKWFTDLVMIPGTNKLAVSTGLLLPASVA
ncbi:unnamed protein product, partial [Timema podura]|nr:unnamed protein product [Timema podura]